MDLHVLQRGAQRVLAARPGEQVSLGAGEVDVRRDDIDLGELMDGLADRDTADEHVVNGEIERVGIEAEREAQTALGIEVDQECA